jgi:hypothetical protein
MDGWLARHSIKSVNLMVPRKQTIDTNTTIQRMSSAARFLIEPTLQLVSDL